MTASTGPAEVRASAAIIVAAVIDEGRSLDELLAAENDEGSARGLKRSLCYGTLRWHFRLAAVLNVLASRPPEQLDPPEGRALDAKERKLAEQLIGALEDDFDATRHAVPSRTRRRLATATLCTQFFACIRSTPLIVVSGISL